MRFSEREALNALIPLMAGNLSNIAESGAVQALTGPVERNDLQTVQKHLACLDTRQKALYRELSLVLADMAREKHPDRNYDGIEGLLK